MVPAVVKVVPTLVDRALLAAMSVSPFREMVPVPDVSVLVPDMVVAPFRLIPAEPAARLSELAPPVLPMLMVWLWVVPALPILMVRAMSEPAPMLTVVLLTLARLTVPAPLVCSARVAVPPAETVRLPAVVDQVEELPAVIVIESVAVTLPVLVVEMA